MTESVLDRVSGIGLVPVVTIERAEDAPPLARALKDGGLPCAEITFRTEAAEAAIRLMAESEPDMLVGAGTVLTADMAKRAKAAGAKFIVSPGLNEDVVRAALAEGMAVIPGCSTPGEIERAMGLGLNAVKIFPAEQIGGAGWLKAVSAPYRSMRFLPTGGITVDNMNSYLALPGVAACGGSWVAPAKLIREGDFAGITALCRQAVNRMLGFRLAHVGINAADGAEAGALAKAFADVFGLGVRAASASVFAGSAVEVMSGNGRGARGHIGFATNSIPRAAAYLDRLGIAYDRKALVRGENGRYPALYLDGEISGFAVHIMEE